MADDFDIGRGVGGDRASHSIERRDESQLMSVRSNAKATSAGSLMTRSGPRRSTVTPDTTGIALQLPPATSPAPAATTTGTAPVILPLVDVFAGLRGAAVSCAQFLGMDTVDVGSVAQLPTAKRAVHIATSEASFCRDGRRAHQ